MYNMVLGSYIACLGVLKTEASTLTMRQKRGAAKVSYLVKSWVSVNLRAVVLINILIAIFTKVKMKSLETPHAKFGNVLSKTINWGYFFLI